MKQNPQENKKVDDEKTEMIDTSSSINQSQNNSQVQVYNNQKNNERNQLLFNKNGSYGYPFIFVIELSDIPTIVKLSGCNKALSALNPKNIKDKISKINSMGYDYFIKNYVETYTQNPHNVTPKNSATLAYLVPNISLGQEKNKDNTVKYLSPNYLAQPSGLNFAGMNLGFDRTKSEKGYRDHILKLMSVFKNIPNHIPIQFSKDNINDMVSFKDKLLIELLERVVQTNEESKYYLIDSIYNHCSKENPKFVLGFILKNMNNCEHLDKNNHVIKMIINCALDSGISVSELCQKIQPLVIGLRSTIKSLAIQKIYQKNNDNEIIKLDIIKAISQAAMQDNHPHDVLPKQIYLNILSDILEKTPEYLLKLEPYDASNLINFKYIDYNFLENIYNKNKAENGEIIIDIINHLGHCPGEHIDVLKHILKDHPKSSAKLNQNIVNQLRPVEDSFVKFIEKNAQTYQDSVKKSISNYDQLYQALNNQTISSDEYLDLYQALASEEYNGTPLVGHNQE